MNTNVPLFRFLRIPNYAPVLALMFCFPLAWAQRVDPPTVDRAAEGRVVPPKTKASDDKSGDVMVLTPFEVAASNNDIGYYAENTLAGSRLNTNIGDLAASITVVTRQQMLDTAAIEMNDVFLYEANTEGTKNFNSFTFNDTGGVTDNNAIAPQTSNRIRGIGTVDRARNYYQSLAQLPFDVYNTESVEILRGPNSMLFGIGSASGIVNQSSSSANVTKQMAEVSGRFGSQDSYRASLRFNQPIISQKLAFFGAAVYNSDGFTRKPSYDISRRAYAAVTYKPFSKTTIKANYEVYNQDMRRPNSVTPRDGISEWRAAGSPSWDPLTFTVTTKGVSQVIRNAQGVPVASFTPESGIPLRTGPSAQRPWMYMVHGAPELWMQAALTNSPLVSPGINIQLPQMASSSTVLRNDTTNRPLFIMPGITDRSLYDWGSINIISSQVTRQDAEVYNIEFDLQLLPNLFLQAGWYQENFAWESFAYNQEEPIMIDVNTRLLDGTPNPYFGRPFTSFPAPRYNDVRTVNDNIRVNLAYTLDFTKKSKWISWLGSQRLFALGARRQVQVANRTRLPNVTSNNVWQNLTNKLGIGLGAYAGNNIIERMYVGGADGRISYDPGLTEGAFPRDIALRYAIPGPTNGLPYSNPNNRFTWVNDPAHIDVPLHVIAGQSEQTTDSASLGVQSSFLHDRIVTTFGIRRDKNSSKATQQLRIDPTTGLANTADLTRFGDTQLIYGNTYTGGVVAKPFKWLSFTYNQSENFSPAPSEQDIFGRILPLPAGKGKDYGLRIYPFPDNRLVFILNAFEAEADRARGNAGALGRLGQIEKNFIEWAGGVARAKLGNNASPATLADETARITQLPAGYAVPTQNINTTSTVSAKGLEAQLIYSPRPNWNLKASFGKQRTTYSSISPEIDEYTATRLPIWLAARDATGAQFWTTPDQVVVNIPSVYYAANVVAPTKLAKALEGKRTRNQREWSGGLISTYRVIEGRLNGLEFGGGARFQDKAVIGYLGKSPEADGVVREYDPDKPVYDHPRPAFDLWLSKSFTFPRFFNRNVKAKVQFNVRNVFEDGNRLVPLAVNPDGVISAYGIVDPREWYLSTTLTF